jgi:hypothetical protein
MKRQKEIMVLSDHTVTLEHHTRRIHILDGPTLTTRKSKLLKKRAFQVTHLVVHWYGDHEPESVKAHGQYVKGDKVINCHRIYNMDEAPKWIKELVNG